MAEDDDDELWDGWRDQEEDGVMGFPNSDECIKQEEKGAGWSTGQLKARCGGL